MEKNSYLELFFETGLRHQYSAEKAVLEELKKMSEKANLPALKELFIHHMGETKNQIERLERIFLILKIDPSSTKLKGLHGMMEKSKEALKTLADLNFSDRSKGIDGIIKEGHEMLRHFAGTDAGDAALASISYKVESYEIGSYKSLILLAETFEQDEVLNLLNESLDEEIEMEEKIGDFANSELSEVLTTNIG